MDKIEALKFAIDNGTYDMDTAVEGAADKIVGRALEKAAPLLKKSPSPMDTSQFLEDDIINLQNTTTI